MSVGDRVTYCVHVLIARVVPAFRQVLISGRNGGELTITNSRGSFDVNTRFQIFQSSYIDTHQVRRRRSCQCIKFAQLAYRSNSMKFAWANWFIDCLSNSVIPTNISVLLGIRNSWMRNLKYIPFYEENITFLT